MWCSVSLSANLHFRSTLGRDASRAEGSTSHSLRSPSVEADASEGGWYWATSHTTIVRKTSIGGFTFVQGDLTFKFDKKFHWFIMFHISILGAWNFVEGGLSPTKRPPWRRECRVIDKRFNQLQLSARRNCRTQETFGALLGWTRL